MVDFVRVRVRTVVPARSLCSRSKHASKVTSTRHGRLARHYQSDPTAVGRDPTTRARRVPGASSSGLVRHRGRCLDHKDSDRPTADGCNRARLVTRRSLAVYDLPSSATSRGWRGSVRLTDRCHYARHVSSDHLDVGVGPGYFLDHRRVRLTRAAALALMNLSTSCLDAASKRVAASTQRSSRPTCSSLSPSTPGSTRWLDVPAALPASDIRSKAVVFDHLIALANPDAWVFATTLLHDGVRPQLVPPSGDRRNNTHGVFSNTVTASRVCDGCSLTGRRSPQWRLRLRRDLRRHTHAAQPSPSVNDSLSRVPFAIGGAVHRAPGPIHHLSACGTLAGASR